MASETIAIYTFSLIFLVFGAIGYLYFGRGYCIDKKAMLLFGAQNCRTYHPETQDVDLLSPCLKKDNGDISLIAETENGKKIFTYSVGVTDHLSKLHYFILISKTSSITNAIYGSEYIYRVAKYNKLYCNTAHGLSGIPADIIYLPEFVEAIEVFNGYSYSFYRLPMLFGFEPLYKVADMLKIRCAT